VTQHEGRAVEQLAVGWGSSQEFVLVHVIQTGSGAYTASYSRSGQLFWLGGHFVEAEVGGGPHLLK
jgi:hypothetical protein